MKKHTAQAKRSGPLHKDRYKAGWAEIYFFFFVLLLASMHSPKVSGNWTGSYDKVPSANHKVPPLLDNFIGLLIVSCDSCPFSRHKK